MGPDRRVPGRNTLTTPKRKPADQIKRAAALLDSAKEPCIATVVEYGTVLLILMGCPRGRGCQKCDDARSRLRGAPLS